MKEKKILLTLVAVLSLAASVFIYRYKNHEEAPKIDWTPNQQIAPTQPPATPVPPVPPKKEEPPKKRVFPRMNPNNG